MAIPLPQRSPCPFCGSERTRYGAYADQDGDFYCVECLDCRASGPITRAFQDDALRLWDERAAVLAERARCAQIAQIVGTAHAYSDMEYANGSAADDIVARIVVALGQPIPAATLAAMQHLARFVLDDVTQQLPVGVIAAADHLYCLARDQLGV